MSDTQPSILSPKVLLPFLAVTMIWGTTWIVIRDQLAVVPPSWSVTYRFLLGGITMLCVALATKVPLRLNRRATGFVALFGVAQFAFNFNFIYRAEAHITSGLVAVVFALLFVPNAVFGRLFLKQKLSQRFIAGSLLAVAGMALLFVNEAHTHPNNTSQTLLGIGLTLLGVVSASTANVMQGSQTARGLPMSVMLGWGMITGAAMDAVFARITSGPPTLELRSGYLIGLLYLGVMASAVAFTLYFQIIRLIGPAKAAYSSVVIPVIAMIISTFAEGYQWTLLAGAGCVLALAGLIIALSPSKRDSPSPE
jgi:drug/metabolite transporter (DMT)-like permease